MEFYVGCDFFKVCDESGDEDEFDIVVWCDCEELFGLCGVECLLIEDCVVELCCCVLIFRKRYMMLRVLFLYCYRVSSLFFVLGSIFVFSLIWMI